MMTVQADREERLEAALSMPNGIFPTAKEVGVQIAVRALVQRAQVYPKTSLFLLDGESAK